MEIRDGRMWRLEMGNVEIRDGRMWRLETGEDAQD